MSSSFQKIVGQYKTAHEGNGRYFRRLSHRSVKRERRDLLLMLNIADQRGKSAGCI